MIEIQWNNIVEEKNIYINLTTVYITDITGCKYAKKVLTDFQIEIPD